MNDSKRPFMRVVSVSDSAEFERDCQLLHDDGYRLVSSASCVVQSEEYGFCEAWHAIFVDAEAERLQKGK